MSHSEKYQVVLLLIELLVDDAREFDGLPISLQLVGRRFEDEKVLAVLEYLQEKGCVPTSGS